MDSTRNVNVDDEVENTRDNGQMTHDNGSSEATDGNRPKSLIMEIYPWLQQFRKMCKSSITQRSMESLKNLMMFYARHVRASVNECHTKPLRADKLKDSMSETLLFFLYYYREIGKDQDRASYMDVMSDLLAMYIDMELKASKKGNEHHSKISARLSSCLHVYLEHSAEYLLDTLLKVHFMTCNYQEILDPVITKIFKGIQEHPISSIMYVRYLLAYRLWKKLNKDVAVRNQINVTALSSLGTAPAEFHPFVIEYVLPKVPKNQKLTTKMLLLQKFEVEKSCEEFLNFCKKERGLDVPTGKDVETSPTDTVASAVPEDNDSRELIVNDSNVENLSTEPEVSSSSASLLIRKSHSSENVNNSKIPSTAESAATPKPSSRRRAKKSNDIVFIDLTSDSATERVIRRKKTRSRLSWFAEAKKRFSVKTAEKKNSTVEDESASAKQLEDTLELLSLRVCSPGSQVEDVLVSGAEEIVVESGEATVEDRTSPESSVTIDETVTTERTASPAPDFLDDRGESHEEDLVEEAATDIEKTPIEEPPSECERVIRETVTESPASDTRITEADNRQCDERSSENKIYDERESCSAESALQLEKCKSPVPCPVAIKAEDVSEEPCEIINEEVVTSAVELPVAEYASEVSLRTSVDEPADETICETKIREVDFQDNIDGLSLLASVSQRVSHLTTKPTIANGSPTTNGELIKVKNYASLANLDAVEEPVTSSEASPFDGDPSPSVINRIVGIYPEDEMDKVAFEVEVTSTGEMDPYGSCDDVNVGQFPPNSDDPYCNSRLQTVNAVPELAAPVEKDDTKVILNGETVVLFQKSPNSNLYIINKAVENRDHVSDDVTSGLREMAEHSVEAGSYPYELYDGLYRGQQASYDIGQYSRELSNQEARRSKKVTVDTVGEAGKPGDSIELAKHGKKKSLSIDVIGKGSPSKRKSSGNSSISRRCRIKQEYNGCSNNLSAHMNTTFAIQDCSQDRVESSRGIHMPVAHSSPLSSIYTKYPGGAELYLPCRKSCNSMNCGLPVNPSAALHPHTGKSSAPTKSHCSCLNCAYDIVAHCTECIMPSGESRPGSIDNASYYLPIHSTVQNSAVQDCGRPSVDEPHVKIYDEQLVCKFEKTILEGKTLSGLGVKCEPEPIYRAELDNKLPLKKRFKAMMSVSFDEMTIKREKVQSYPSTPMLSIAALEAQDALGASEDVDGDGKNSLEASTKCRGETHLSNHQRDFIRRDYRKEPATMMSPPPTTPMQITTSNSTGVRKRKRRSAPSSCNVDEASYERMLKSPVKHKQSAVTGAVVSKRLTTPTKSQARPSEKVRELDVPPTKNATRRTRSSKRNVPKVNYIYTDGDSDWNPSDGGSKRKRKKTSR